MGACAIIPIAAAIALLCRKKIEETLFPAICVIIITLMCFGLFNHLKLGLYIIQFLLVLSFVTLFICKKEIKKYIITSGFFAFIIYFLLFFILTNSTHFISKDSLSKYGPQILNIYKTDMLKNSNLYYNLNKSFPFVSLWSYFVIKCGKNFSEWKSIFSCSLFIISGVMPLFTYIKNVKKEKINYLLLFFICLFLPIFKIKDAFIDYDMAIPQATALVYSFLSAYNIIFHKNNKQQYADYVFLGIGIFASCTITEWGVFLSLPLIIGINVVSIYDIFGNKNKRKRSLYLLLTSSIAAFSTIIWSMYQYKCGEIEINRVFFIPAVTLGVLVLSFCVALCILLYERGNKVMVLLIVLILIVFISVIFGYELKHSVYHNYVKDELLEYTDKLFLGDRSIIIGDMSEEEYVIGNKYIKVYDVTLLLLSIIITGFACRNTKKISIEKYNLKVRYNLGIILGSMIYLMILAIVYINVIREPKGHPVPSIADYITPLILLLFVSLFNESYFTWKKEKVLLIIAIFLGLCVVPYIKKYYFIKPIYVNEYPLISECIENGKIELTGRDRVFYIDRDLLEPLPQSFVWEVFPAGANSISGMYYNPEPYKWSDIERTMTPEEFEELINKGAYTYVYIKNVDDYFITTFYPDFDNWGLDIRNDALYKVEYNDEGQLQIKYIAE